MANSGTGGPKSSRSENVINKGTIVGAGKDAKLQRNSSIQKLIPFESEGIFDSDDYQNSSIEDLNKSLTEANLALERKIEVLIIKANIDKKRNDEEIRRIARTKDTEINILQSAISKKEQQIEGLEVEVWKAKQEISEFQNVKRALEEAKENIKKLKEENNKLNKENRILSKELQDMRNACDLLKNELKDKNEEISLLKQNTIQELKCKLQGANERIEHLIGEQEKQGPKFEVEGAVDAATVSQKMDEMHNEMKEMKSMMTHLTKNTVSDEKMHNEMKEIKSMMKYLLTKNAVSVQGFDASVIPEDNSVKRENNSNDVQIDLTHS